jgi:hypothetical protein
MTDPLDQLLAELNAKLDEIVPPPSPVPLPKAKPALKPIPSGDDLDDLLASVRAQTQEKNRIEAEKQKLRQQKALQQQKQQEAAHRARWQNEAQQWLRQLDPLSSEGLWFRDFACNYPSELDAAIAYLFPASS